MSNNTPTHKTRNASIRALGLASGGLDSILAALVLREQAIEVEWVNFETPFFSSHKARLASRNTGIPLRVENITPVYINMLRDPHCGYGSNMNPCLDCHALMLEIAGSIMTREGFDFLFTGEVVGQRPMSQTKPSLRYVEKRSGLDGHILRPLSARLLPPTIAEERGLVDRRLLLGLSGRSRKEQIRLAGRFGIDDYPAPGGGCLLTDPGFSRRVKDLLENQHRIEERDLELLKHGRHFRIRPDAKVIVGRTMQDNAMILSLADPDKDIQIQMLDMPGPTALIPFGGPEDVVSEAAGLCVAYSKCRDSQSVRVSANGPGWSRVLAAGTAPRDKYRPYLI